MNKIFCLLLLACTCHSMAQTSLDKPKILYGVCTKDSLIAEPFGKWYSPNYENYIPEPATLVAFKKEDLSNISIKVFFGTWCGDSKREVPRFLKLLNALSFPEKKIQLIGLGGSDSLVKQSPQHEEAGLGIFRVPTFIVYRNGVEINRINEFPVFSLEKDLLSIVADKPYTPNYHSFHPILKWLNDGILTDENTSTRGLAEQLRPNLSGEHELNSLGYLLMKQGKKKEALKIFQVNYSIYPESSNIASSLGEGYYENNEYKRSVALLERSLELNKDPAALKEILPLLYKAKEKEGGNK